MSFSPEQYAMNCGWDRHVVELTALFGLSEIDSKVLDQEHGKQLLAWCRTQVGITVEHDKLGGSPCIRGFRLAVDTVVSMFKNGMTIDEVLEDHSYLEKTDVDWIAVRVKEKYNEY